MARGGKRGHKGGTKRFTNPQQLAADREKEEKAKAWRRQRGEESSSSEEEEEEANDASDESGPSDDDGVSFQKVTTKKKTAGGAGARAESTSESSEESSDDEDRKKKGVEGLIEIENPNLKPKKEKKVSELTAPSSSKPQLTRREREEIDKQKAKAHYQKLHAAGKTDEARADLARLAIIRKQREEAAKKREDEQKAKEEAAKSKKDTTDKATGKKK